MSGGVVQRPVLMRTLQKQKGCGTRPSRELDSFYFAAKG